MSNTSNQNFQQYQQAPAYNSFVNQPVNTVQLNNFNFSNNIRPLNTQYNQNLYRFGISTSMHVDQQIRQLQTDPQTGLPYENTSSKNPKEKYPPLISVLMLLEELSSKFSFGFDLYFQIDQKMMSFIASTALNEEDNSRQGLTQFDIIECIRQLSSSYDIFCLEEKDIFEIACSDDTSRFAQLVNLPYHFQITYASIYQNLKRQKQNLGSSQNYQQQQQMYNNNYNQQQGQQGEVQNQQPYNQQGSNQYVQNQQGYNQQNNQQFNMQQQGGQNQQYQNMYPNQMQNYPQQMIKNQMGVDMNQIYQPNINQPNNMGVQQQVPPYGSQMYYNQPQVKKERKKRTSNKSKQPQQQQAQFSGYGSQGQNDDQVYLSDQSQDDDEEEEEENDLGRASMVTKKIKKLSYVSRASQLQTFNEVKQYLEPFFSTPRSTSTLSRFFVVFSTEPRPGMDDPTAYLERLDEQMIRFVEKYKEHTGQELEMYKKDYDSENKRLYAFQNTEFYGTTRRSLYSKHISTVANLMGQNKKEKFAFAAKDVLIINGAQGVRTHDLANKIDISKRLAAKKFKKKEVIDEKKKNIEAMKQQKKNQPKVYHNIIANMPTPKGEKTKQQKFFEKPTTQSSKQSKTSTKSKDNKETHAKKEKKAEKPKKEKAEKVHKQETEKQKKDKNKGGYNYNSQDTTYLSVKPTYDKLYAPGKNFRSKRMQERQQKTIQLEDEKQIEQFAQQQLYGDSYLQGNSMNQHSQQQGSQSQQHQQHQQYDQQQQQQQDQQNHQQIQQESHNESSNNNNTNNNNQNYHSQQGDMLEVEGHDNNENNNNIQNQQEQQQQNNKNNELAQNNENQIQQQYNDQNGDQNDQQNNEDNNNYQQQNNEQNNHYNGNNVENTNQNNSNYQQEQQQDYQQDNNMNENGNDNQNLKHQNNENYQNENENYQNNIINSNNQHDDQQQQNEQQDQQINQIQDQNQQIQEENQQQIQE